MMKMLVGEVWKVKGKVLLLVVDKVVVGVRLLYKGERKVKKGDLVYMKVFVGMVGVWGRVMGVVEK